MEIGTHCKSELFLYPGELTVRRRLQNHSANKNQWNEFHLAASFLLRKDRDIAAIYRALWGMFSDTCKAFVLNLMRMETNG